MIFPILLVLDPYPVSSVQYQYREMFSISLKISPPTEVEEENPDIIRFSLLDVQTSIGIWLTPFGGRAVSLPAQLLVRLAIPATQTFVDSEGQEYTVWHRWYA